MGVLTEEYQFDSKANKNCIYMGIYIWAINELGMLTPAMFLPSTLDYVECIAFSPDNQYVFEVNRKSDIAVWDISNKILPQKIFIYKQLVRLYDTSIKIRVDASGQKIALLYGSQICIYNWDKSKYFLYLIFQNFKEGFLMPNLVSAEDGSLLYYIMTRIFYFGI